MESGLSLIAFAICISFSFEAPTLLCINGEKHAQTKEVFWDPAQAPRAYSGFHFYCLSLARTWSELLDIAFCLSGAEQLLLTPLTKFHAFASHAQVAQHLHGAGASDKKLLLGNAMAVFQERRE